MLYRGVETIDGNDSVYYDYIKYNNEGGNYTIDPDGDIVTFNSTTIGAETLNSSVSIYRIGTNNMKNKYDSSSSS